MFLVAGEVLASSVLQSPKSTPQQCSAAHGPLHPALCSSEIYVCLLSLFGGFGCYYVCLCCGLVGEPDLLATLVHKKLVLVGLGLSPVFYLPFVLLFGLHVAVLVMVQANRLGVSAANPL